MIRARWRTRALGAVVVAATLLTTPVLAGPVLAGPVPATPNAPAARTDTETDAPETGDPDSETEPDEETTPLAVTLTSMTPASIPRKGAITLTGTVTNISVEDWVDVNVAPIISTSPITTRDELTEAAATDPDVAVGERLTDPGTYAAVGDLAPRQRATFTIRVPVASSGLASGAPGVYWIGVHALGASPEGRDQVADGRARTFIPLVPPAVARKRSVPVSVLVPLRERARRAEDGSLNGPARWKALTGPEGRLTRLAEFGASAGAAPLSWILDPAVLDALEDYSRGNPPLSLGTEATGENPDDQGDQGDQGGEPSAAASPSPTPEPSPDAPSEEERSRAGNVLDTLLTSLRSHDLLTLGYADPDVTALARRRPNLLAQADALAARRLKARGLSGTTVVAPPNGYLDPELLPEVSPDSVLVLTDRGRLQDPPVSRLPSGQELVLSDARAGAGGPTPTPPLDALALRQRILSEAALEATKGTEETRPIVVSLPARWNPGPHWRQADFFGGLQRSWVRLVQLPSGAGTTFEGQLGYDQTQLAAEVPSSNVAATSTLVRTGTILGQLLATDDNGAADRLTGAALQASSYNALPSPETAADLVLDLDANVRDQMGQVRVTGTDFVTLSGGSGSLTVTLVNGLDQPITVGIQARADSPEVEIDTPEPVSMQAGQRTTLRLQVTSGIGVHDVTLSPVTAEGETAGTPLTFSLRTSQVGQLIWYIMAAGGTLLAVMIARRIVLRIRNHRWREAETP